MTKDLKQVTQEWVEEIEMMKASTHYIPPIFHEIRAMDEVMSDMGYTPVYANGMSCVAQYYNKKRNNALMINLNESVDGMPVWDDMNLSRNDWVLYRRPLNEDCDEFVSYLVPSLALYDIGVKGGFRKPYRIFAYDEIISDGIESTMEILVNQGIAINLGMYYTANDTDVLPF